MYSFLSDTMPTAANRTDSAGLDLRGARDGHFQIGRYRPFQVICEFRLELGRLFQEEKVEEEVSHLNKRQV